jgi:hypothetical protein
MPLKDRFYDRDIPFVINLKCKENPCKSCQNKCTGEEEVPQSSVELQGKNFDATEDITD